MPQGSFARRYAVLGEHCRRLIWLLPSNDWRACEAQWAEIRGALERVMADECEAARAFALESWPEGASLVEQVRAKHGDIRRQARWLGIAIRARALRAKHVHDLVDALRWRSLSEGDGRTAPAEVPVEPPSIRHAFPSTPLY
ncbi:MAG TPA: hypothetical protein VFS00_34540 [Polyangiaceae bacterium]|nr:hypothetical protein [Polyangiaceae bacterium]